MNDGVIETFDLDALCEDDLEWPTGRAAELLKPIDRRQLCRAEVVQLVGGAWLLRWTERHPEMIPRDEYVTEKGDEEAESGYFDPDPDDDDDHDPADAWKKGEPTMECACADAVEQAEYDQLRNLLPPKASEIPLTRQEAFLLVAVCWLPEEFWPEIGSLL